MRKQGVFSTIPQCHKGVVPNRMVRKLVRSSLSKGLVESVADLPKISLGTPGICKPHAGRLLKCIDGSRIEICFDLIVGHQPVLDFPLDEVKSGEAVFAICEIQRVVEQQESSLDIEENEKITRIPSSLKQ